MTQQSNPTGEALAERAQRLYPDKPALQAAWLRAIALVRSTSRGWLLDQPVQHRKAVR